MSSSIDILKQQIDSTCGSLCVALNAAAKELNLPGAEGREWGHAKYDNFRASLAKWGIHYKKQENKFSHSSSSIFFTSPTITLPASGVWDMVMSEDRKTKEEHLGLTLRTLNLLIEQEKAIAKAAAEEAEQKAAAEAYAREAAEKAAAQKSAEEQKLAIEKARADAAKKEAIIRKKAILVKEAADNYQIALEQVDKNKNLVTTFLVAKTSIPVILSITIPSLMSKEVNDKNKLISEAELLSRVLPLVDAIYRQDEDRGIAVLTEVSDKLRSFILSPEANENVIYNCAQILIQDMRATLQALKKPLIETKSIQEKVVADVRTKIEGLEAQKSILVSSIEKAQQLVEKSENEIKEKMKEFGDKEKNRENLGKELVSLVNKEIENNKETKGLDERIKLVEENVQDLSKEIADWGARIKLEENKRAEGMGKIAAYEKSIGDAEEKKKTKVKENEGLREKKSQLALDILNAETDVKSKEENLNSHLDGKANELKEVIEKLIKDHPYLNPTLNPQRDWNPIERLLRNRKQTDVDLAKELGRFLDAIDNKEFEKRDVLTWAVSKVRHLAKAMQDDPDTSSKRKASLKALIEKLDEANHLKISEDLAKKKEKIKIDRQELLKIDPQITANEDKCKELEKIIQSNAALKQKAIDECPKQSSIDDLKAYQKASEDEFQKSKEVEENLKKERVGKLTIKEDIEAQEKSSKEKVDAADKELSTLAAEMDGKMQPALAAAQLEEKTLRTQLADLEQNEIPDAIEEQERQTHALQKIDDVPLKRLFNIEQRLEETILGEEEVNENEQETKLVTNVNLTEQGAQQPKVDLASFEARAITPSAPPVHSVGGRAATSLPSHSALHVSEANSDYLAPKDAYRPNVSLVVSGYAKDMQQITALTGQQEQHKEIMRLVKGNAEKQQADQLKKEADGRNRQAEREKMEKLGKDLENLKSFQEISRNTREGRKTANQERVNKRGNANKLLASQFYGATDIQSIADGNRRRQNLEDIHDLEKERVRLGDLLDRFQQRYEGFKNYHEGDHYRDDEDKRVEFFDNFVRKSFSQIITKYQDRDSIISLEEQLTPHVEILSKLPSLQDEAFLTNFDKIAEIIFDFIEKAEQKDVAVVAELVKEVLPLLGENSTFAKFREKNFLSATIRAAARNNFSQELDDIKSIQAELIRVEAKIAALNKVTEVDIPVEELVIPGAQDDQKEEETFQPAAHVSPTQSLVNGQQLSPKEQELAAILQQFKDNDAIQIGQLRAEVADLEHRISQQSRKIGEQAEKLEKSQQRVLNFLQGRVDTLLINRKALYENLQGNREAIPERAKVHAMLCFLESMKAKLANLTAQTDKQEFLRVLQDVLEEMKKMRDDVRSFLPKDVVNSAQSLISFLLTDESKSIHTIQQGSDARLFNSLDGCLDKLLNEKAVEKASAMDQPYRLDNVIAGMADLKQLKEEKQRLENSLASKAAELEKEERRLNKIALAAKPDQLAVLSPVASRPDKIHGELPETLPNSNKISGEPSKSRGLYGFFSKLAGGGSGQKTPGLGAVSSRLGSV